MADKNRFERGVQRMKELFGDTYSPPSLGDELMDISFGHLFGDIWTRPGLELRERSMITCTALVVMGKELQLKTHLRGALNAGISRQVIEEMMIHLAHYSGWPTAVNGLRVAREIFEEMDAQTGIGE